MTAQLGQEFATIEIPPRTLPEPDHGLEPQLAGLT
jgi:hypothetical protein